MKHFRNTLRPALCTFLLLAPLAVQAPHTLAEPSTAQDKIKFLPEATKREIELGKKQADLLEKNPKIKFIDAKDPKNKELLDKLNSMARELGKVSRRPKIEYSVKVIEEEDTNAFTLPAGRIYMTRGLLNLAGSDDELAAVLAHEIGHTEYMHVTRGETKMKPLQWAGLAAMAAMMAGGKAGADVSRIAPYILTGIANTYSVEFEQEADHAAIDQMKQTKYNPSAMVTFMQKLRDEERRRPEVDLGIYQTHPATPERVHSAMQSLQAAGIPYTPRDVVGSRQATVIEPKDKPNVAAVQFGNVTLLELAPLTTTGAPPNAVASATVSTSVQAPVTTPSATPGTQTTTTQPSTQAAAVAVANPFTAKARAEAVATRINDLLRANLRWHEIRVSGDDSGATLVARETVIARVTPADAKLENTTPLALAQKWKNNFGRLFWNETISGKL
ncbi:MAG TPA: M48 family metalloprotease [Abditibacteriaceae bacterium]